MKPASKSQAFPQSAPEDCLRLDHLVCSFQNKHPRVHCRPTDPGARQVGTRKLCRSQGLQVIFVYTGALITTSLIQWKHRQMHALLRHPLPNSHPVLKSLARWPVSAAFSPYSHRIYIAVVLAQTHFYVSLVCGLHVAIPCSQLVYLGTAHTFYLQVFLPAIPSA